MKQIRKHLLLATNTQSLRKRRFSLRKSVELINSSADTYPRDTFFTQINYWDKQLIDPSPSTSLPPCKCASVDNAAGNSLCQDNNLFLELADRKESIYSHSTSHFAWFASALIRLEWVPFSWIFECAFKCRLEHELERPFACACSIIGCESLYRTFTFKSSTRERFIGNY